MNAESSSTVPAARGPSRVAATIGFVLAVVALLMLVAGPIGWRAGWWHYRIGTLTLMPYAGYVGLAAVAISALALIFAMRTNARRGAIVLGVLGLLIGGTAAYIPWHWNSQRGLYPRVNDVTSDFVSPPSLAFAEVIRKAEHGHPVAYRGAEMAAVQKKSYPDIMPAMLDLPLAKAFGRALAAAKAKGWTILNTDPEDGTIAATDRSRWFGFTDDIAIRVTPAGAGSRVDIRSAARQGGGDYGVNANRVRDYLAALREPAAGR